MRKVIMFNTNCHEYNCYRRSHLRPALPCVEVGLFSVAHFFLLISTKDFK